MADPLLGLVSHPLPVIAHVSASPGPAPALGMADAFPRLRVDGRLTSELRRYLDQGSWL